MTDKKKEVQEEKTSVMLVGEEAANIKTHQDGIIQKKIALANVRQQYLATEARILQAITAPIKA